MLPMKLLATKKSIGNTEDSGKYSFDNKTKGKACDVLPVKSDDYPQWCKVHWIC